MTAEKPVLSNAVEKLQTLKFSVENGLATLTVNRPEVLNALSRQVLDELVIATNEVKRLDLNHCRCLVITGAGEKAFVAGADVKGIQSLHDLREAQAFAEYGQGVFRELEKLNVPVIAAVNGFALGGGLELALACDFILASENAKFGLPEVGLGLIPGYGGTVRLARSVGLNRARQLIFTGEMISAQEALAWNLVSVVVPAAEFANQIQKVTQTICKKGPMAIAWAKKTVQKAVDMELDQALRLESKHFGELMNYKDTREGMAAFLEKRAAQFRAQ